ncbi:DUF5999 family protein [Nonomuraea zeae]|uniref:Uncharacterized protein n=1 Tax=Nonomuraea zeae TaxID=1642303 RepID=A0A5S4G5R9_9ACTN|nr:DUF5999 family protein [Nonomuraea zeae]TMR28356.1 hypothetical protein ETD85_36045 [Nonomuraea zeae]
MCQHRPRCPSATSCRREAARLVVFHPEQGWGLLCNGVVVFDDTGELLPDGRSVPAYHVLPERAR